MGLRRLAREIALQALYLADTSSLDTGKAYDIATGKLEKLGTTTADFAQRLVTQTLSCKQELDRAINKHAENWDLSRMAVVDRNILRMASYELLNEPETPASVIIDEALEIAKKYSSRDSSRFINGILDKIKDHAEGAGNRKASPRNQAA